MAPASRRAGASASASAEPVITLPGLFARSVIAYAYAYEFQRGRSNVNVVPVPTVDVTDRLPP